MATLMLIYFPLIQNGLKQYAPCWLIDCRVKHVQFLLMMTMLQLWLCDPKWPWWSTVFHKNMFCFFLQTKNIHSVQPFVQRSVSYFFFLLFFQKQKMWFGYLPWKVGHLDTSNMHSKVHQTCLKQPTTGQSKNDSWMEVVAWYCPD